MVFRGNGGGIGRRTAERKGGGGDYDSSYTRENLED